MDEIREMLMWIRPGGNFTGLTPETRLMEDLGLSSCEGLGLAAMIEARCGRIFGWEAELHSLGDLLAYLARQGIELQ